jgi:hypothetical protein
MKLEIRTLSWYKRREPTKEIQPIEVEIEDLQLISNHYSNMRVLYDDGNWYDLTGRVTQNDITGKWSIQGLNPHGLSCLVDVIE